VFQSNLFKDSKAFLSSRIRALEINNAGSNEDRLKEIGQQSDEATLRKWFWKATIVGAPVCFIGVPLLLSMLGLLLSGFVMQFLWFVTKLAMAVVIALYALAAYLTFRSDAA
jgi:hypothetical protein